MEKYHYDPEEYPNLKRLAGEMIPCLETEAGWQDREIQETFPGRDQSFLAVGITLGKGIDELQEKYLQNGFLTESYMIEVLSSELLLESYRAYTEWLVVTSMELNSKCKSYSGVSAAEWISQYVLLEAKDLLIKTRLRPSRIAVMLNFSNYDTFARWFRRHTGELPGNWR